jgi:hypothetical protein
MSSMRSEYSKLALYLVSLEENLSHTPKKLSMEEEKKNDREKYYINLLLVQALMQHRDTIMEKFSHILQCLLIKIGASSSSDHFGGTSPVGSRPNWKDMIFWEGRHARGKK